MTLKKVLCLIITVMLCTLLAVSCDLGSFNPTNPPEPPTPQLLKIEILSGSVVTECYVDETVNTAGLVVVATYTDNSVKNLTLADITIVTAPDTSSAGNTSLVVSYGGKTVSAPITVKEHVLSEMTVTGFDASYVYGSTINTENVVVTAKYLSGKQETIPYTKNSGITLNLPNTMIPGQAAIEVSYLGKSVSIDVEITDPMTSIELDTEHRTFVFNKNSDRATVESVLANLTINAIYASGKAVSVGYSDLVIDFTQIDTATPTTEPKNFDISYAGLKTQATYTVTNEPKFSALTLDPSSTFSTSYAPGDALDDISKLKVKAVLSNGTTIDAIGTDSEKLRVAGLSDINTLVTGKYSITVTYTDGQDSVSMQLPITVYGVRSISVTGLRTEYKRGDTFDTTFAGMIVTIVYENGDYTEFYYTDIANADIIQSEFEICGTVNTAIAGKYSICFKYLGTASSLYNVYVKTVIIPSTDKDENVTEKKPLG